MLTTYSIARRRRALIAVLALGATALSSAFADAHFRLITPGNWMVQSTDGSPQKMGPCGNEAPQTPSNVVTAFRPGDTVTVQLEETVYHPGHYRVALAVNSPSELPAEPPVTAGSTACGSVPIQATPMFPILADGMLQHTSPFTTPQSFQVKLPTNVTCSACTLQIIEFMSEHGAPCFYHHCATISIGAATDAGSAADAARDASDGSGGAAGSAGTGADGSATGGGGQSGAGLGGSAGSSTGGSGTAGAQGGSDGSSGESGGCSCSLARSDARSIDWAGIVVALGLVSTRRRRRRHTRRS